MAEFLKHKNSDLNRELFEDIFNIYDLNVYESIFLFSRIDYEAEEIFKVLSKDLIGKKKMVFIASTPNNDGTNDKYFQVMREYFKKFSIEEFILIDYRISKFACIKHVESADIIFLMGGDTLTQFEFIKEYEIDSLISRFKGIIMGMSAGAINLGETSYCSKDDDFPETIIYKGLGLTSLSINPHFDINNELQVQEMLKTDIDIIGLPDNTFIKIDKYGKQTIYGEYYIKENNKIVKGQ